MEHNLASNPQADILVIDDVPDNIRLLSKMLLEQGYTVRKALNGQMALTAAQKVTPDLILLDINMPEMNGYEVCTQLKSNPQTSSTPVIFLSALDDVIDKVQAFKVGGVDFITKPFYFEEVLVRVQTQLAIRNLQSQLQAQNGQLQQALNNPKGEYIRELLYIISTYQQEYPNPTLVVKKALESVNFDLINSELTKLVNSEG